MRQKIFATITLFFSFSSALALTNSQKVESISGRVIDSASREGVEDAFVFFSNTTKGARTNKVGFFRIHRPPVTSGKLLVAKAGYQTGKMLFEAGESTEGLELQLTGFPRVGNRNMRTAAERVQQDYFVEVFKQVFLGSAETVSAIELINEEELAFFHDAQKNTLVAYANAPLIIENRATGYRIVFVLNYFKCFNLGGKMRFTYAGDAYFTEMIPQIDGNLEEWQENRYRLYRGSLRHFLWALANDRLASSGFSVMLADYSVERDSIEDINAILLPESLLQAHNDTDHYLLKFPAFLRVAYEFAGNLEKSWLYLNRHYAILTVDGKIIEPFNALTLQGVWANQSFSQFLPQDYQPRPTETLGYLH